MQSKINNEIEKAIVAHSRWKTHLKKAIATGESHLSVSTARNPHLCDFGKWLDSKEGKMLSDYPQIVELHREFHEKAAQILDLALSEKTDEALTQIQLGSPFNQLTAKLVNKLAELKLS